MDKKIISEEKKDKVDNISIEDIWEDNPTLEHLAEIHGRMPKSQEQMELLNKLEEEMNENKKKKFVFVPPDDPYRIPRFPMHDVMDDVQKWLEEERKNKTQDEDIPF